MSEQLFSLRVLIASLSSIVLYFSIFHLFPRSSFFLFISCYTGLFVFYLVTFSKLTLRETQYLGVIFRLVALFSIPTLSDDYFRFLWDGQLINLGISPYLHIPSSIIYDSSINADLNPLLFEQMNSPDYYTVYQPFNQLIFSLSTWLFGSEGGLWSLVGLKLPILLAEIGTILYLPKLLNNYGLEKKGSFLYILNPLVVIEICGNAHFEGIMIFFLIIGLLLLKQQKLFVASLLWGLSISIKLFPIFFLPLLIKSLGLKKWLIFVSLAALINLIFWVPFMEPDFLTHVCSSIKLYFQVFQFNSFFYNILNTISNFQYQELLGGLLMLIPTAYLLQKSRSNRDDLIPGSMVKVQSIYYLFSAVVHPWYLTTIVALNTISQFRFVAAWSYLVGLSYYTYRTEQYLESPFLVAFEYFLLFGFMTYDYLRSRHTTSLKE